MKTLVPKVRKPKEFVRDSETGIRNFSTINNLPVKELTDDEIVKIFFHRFEANALLMMYADKEGITGLFGRIRYISKNREKYKELEGWLNSISHHYDRFKNDLKLTEETEDAI